MDKVTINIYKDKEQLGEVCSMTYTRLCKDIRAWYRYRKRTIYVNLGDLNEKILAHELAHAIIDRHLVAPPGGASGEMLARYVAKNLKK